MGSVVSELKETLTLVSGIFFRTTNAPRKGSRTTARDDTGNAISSWIAKEPDQNVDTRMNQSKARFKTIELENSLIKDAHHRAPTSSCSFNFHFFCPQNASRDPQTALLLHVFCGEGC